MVLLVERIAAGNGMSSIMLLLWAVWESPLLGEYPSQTGPHQRALMILRSKA